MLVGLGASTAYLIPWSLLPDAIDADPTRPAGLYTALDGVWAKTDHWPQHERVWNLALAHWIHLTKTADGALSSVQQPETALIAIRLCMGLIPAVLVVLGLLLMRRWPDRGAHLHNA